MIDSSAWIEYLFGTPAGKKAGEIIENPANQIITPNIVVAEVVSKYLRLGENPEKAIFAMNAVSAPPLENRGAYVSAGFLHIEMRKNHKRASLADAIIATVAENNNAKIVTKDLHLKGKNSIFIG